MKSPKYKIGDIVIIEPGKKIKFDCNCCPKKYPKYFEGIVSKVEWSDISKDWIYGIEANLLDNEELFYRFKKDIIKKIN